MYNECRDKTDTMLRDNTNTICHVGIPTSPHLNNKQKSFGIKTHLLKTRSGHVLFPHTLSLFAHLTPFTLLSTPIFKNKKMQAKCTPEGKHVEAKRTRKLANQKTGNSTK